MGEEGTPGSCGGKNHLVRGKLLNGPALAEDSSAKDSEIWDEEEVSLAPVPADCV